MTAYRERPSSWYDSPDEPTDAQHDACHSEWTDYLADYCEDDVWHPQDDSDVARCDSIRPCWECVEHPPQPYDEWAEVWHARNRGRD